MVKKAPCYFPKTTYTCPICGKVFSEYEEAEACTDTHPSIGDVVGFEQYTELPAAIIVEMSDGRRVRFISERVLEPENETEAAADE